MPVVRKFIRNRKTGLFLAPGGGWTSDVGKALEFYNDLLLQKAYTAQHLSFCDLYFCFAPEPSHLDFAFPLSRLPWLKRGRPSDRTQTAPRIYSERPSAKG